ncbi:MAG: hypothetical protein R3E83_06665 [Burkholderiaceae bacterium]
MAASGRTRSTRPEGVTVIDPTPAPGTGTQSTPTAQLQLELNALALLNVDGEFLGGSSSAWRSAAARCASNSTRATPSCAPWKKRSSCWRTSSNPLHTTGAIIGSATIWWLARTGGLLSALLLGAPTWRTIDPLPIVSRASTDTASEPDAEHHDSENQLPLL